MERKSRQALVIEIMRLVLDNFPARWRAKELASATGGNIRTVERALRDMQEGGILEKTYHFYSLPAEAVQKVLGSNFYLRQETRKSIELGKNQ